MSRDKCCFLAPIEDGPVPVKWDDATEIAATAADLAADRRRASRMSPARSRRAAQKLRRLEAGVHHLARCIPNGDPLPSPASRAAFLPRETEGDFRAVPVWRRARSATAPWMSSAANTAPRLTCSRTGCAARAGGRARKRSRRKRKNISPRSTLEPPCSAPYSAARPSPRDHRPRRRSSPLDVAGAQGSGRRRT